MMPPVTFIQRLCGGCGCPASSHRDGKCVTCHRCGQWQSEGAHDGPFPPDTKGAP